MNADWTERDFVGGTLCLDFANTLGGWHKEQSIERLDSYPTLLGWARTAEMIDPSEHDALKKAAARSLDEAAAELAEVKRLREAIFDIFSALAADAEPPQHQVERLRVVATQAIAAALLSLGGAWKISVEAAGLKAIRWRIALAAFRLCDGTEPASLKECGRCSWLFLDRSKNKRRLWCDSTTCGNRTRAERHYRRSKADQG